MHGIPCSYQPWFLLLFSMALFPKLFLAMLFLTILALAVVPDFTEARTVAQQLQLVERLQSDGLKVCWDSLMELRSCTGEVILFFLNGETYLGPSCCRAIRVIVHHCWTAEVMLAALGFTPQEGDVLRGYCDAEASAGASPPPPPPVAYAPLPEHLVH
ncbi:unnamed protein product [Musa hybrid cultivar]